MAKVVGLLSSTLGGAAGWWLGEALGGGIMGAFIVSMIGTGIGIYAGRRIAQEFLD
jgi:hypothetical protein